jgi:hypothetical protein
MFELIRLAVVGFVVLTVIYVALSIWSRRVRRGRLEREWDNEVRTGDRREYVRIGLRAYDASLRRKLILGVYVVPVVVVAVIIYVVNFT